MTRLEKAGLTIFLIGLVSILAVLITQRGSNCAIAMAFIAMIGGSFLFIVGGKPA